ncbi:MAG: hydrolase [Pseudomonadota bacterium]
MTQTLSLTADEQAALDSIDQDHMLKQVQDWSAINSGSGNLDGLTHMAKVLQLAFSVLPGSAELVDPDPVEQMTSDGSIRAIKRGQHLVVRVRPNANFRLLFTGHMDTVFPVDHPFQQQKWLEPGILNGPGLADMKGGISVMLAALQAVEKAGTSIGYDILINSDEEVGSGASAALIAELASGKVAALTYEPALPDGTLAGARGGSGNYAIHITGRSAHAGRNPEEGRNAIVAASALAVALKGLTREGLACNPAKIEGGAANNVVPDHAILHVNFRPKTPDMQSFAEQSLDQLMEAVAAEHEVSIHAHGGFGRPPKPIDDQAEKLFTLVKQCGADLGLSISHRATGGVCDGNNIAACGVPVVDTMGVRGGAIHSSDEFMIVDSLAERARLSALTIMRMEKRGGL